MRMQHMNDNAPHTPGWILPRTGGVTGATMAGDIIGDAIKPGSGIPTTPRPPSYETPKAEEPTAPAQGDPGDECTCDPPAAPETPEPPAAAAPRIH